MKHTYATLFALLFLGSMATAQTYCSPTFSSGCGLWQNQSVSIGTINWTIGSTACTISDYTALSTVLTPGVAEPMTVVSGNWTGCSVWIDLNNNQAFEDVENMYHTYVGGDPSFTYSFTITVPGGTPAGSYRMRVIAPWGSDGYTPGSPNGFGPCGAYQYGNFDDFTVEVAGSTGITTMDAASMDVRPNPTTGLVSLTQDANDRIQQVIITAPEGRTVKQFAVGANEKAITLDLSALPAGLYLLTAHGATGVHTTRLLKE